VDDDPSIRGMLRRVLIAEGHEVEMASDGAEGLASVRRSPPDLVMLDVDMPTMPGDELCRRLKSDPATRLIPVVMITGDGTRGKVDAWDNGADEFLPKPFQLHEVAARCRSLIRIKRLIEERDGAEAVLFALVRTVEAKSAFTHGHSGRVAQYTEMLARHIGVGADSREVLRKGSLLHDIGKIGIPDAILDKPGKLTAAEYDEIKEHPARGAHIVEPLASLRDTLPLIRSHHERLDGKGYPDGLSADQIPLLVRILSVCDVFDSLSSDRPYRSSIPLPLCLEIMRKMAADGGLDGALVEDFCGLVAPAGQALELVAAAHI
jgi:putative two-component system response regulator